MKLVRVGLIIALCCGSAAAQTGVVVKATCTQRVLVASAEARTPAASRPIPERSS